MNQSTTAPNESDRQSTAESAGHPPPPQPQPMMPYPGYAQPPYYQGYPMQPPYPTYPDPSHNHQSMPPQNINGAYYTPGQFPQTYPEQRRDHSLARGILCTITILVIVTTSMSIIIWAIYGSNIPQFAVESMYVPKFEFNNSTLNAIWEANVNVHNPNKKIKVTFEHIEGRLVYRGSLIDESMVEPIWNLGSNEDRIMTAKFEVPHSGYDHTGAFWYQLMEEDRKKGSIWLGLRFVTYASFNSDDGFWRRSGRLAIICDNILVEFPDATGGGKWNGKKQNCYITA